MNGAREFVQALAVSRTNPKRVDLYALLAHACAGVRAETLVSGREVSRETVYRRFREFEQLGLINHEPGGKFRTTRPGWMAMRAYARVAERFEPEELAYLASSPARRDVIRSLDGSPADKATLAADPHLPSRATIHRTLAQFEEYGWIVDSPGRQYRIHEDAVIAAAQLEWLYTAVQEAIEKAPAIQTMAYWADPSAHTLVGTKLNQQTPGVPNTMLNAIVDLSGLRTGEFERLQAVVPALDVVTVDYFEETFFF